MGAQLGHIPRFCLAHLHSLAAPSAEDSAQTIRYLEEALALAETIHLPGEQKTLLAQLAQLSPDIQAVRATGLNIPNLQANTAGQRPSSDTRPVLRSDGRYIFRGSG